MRRCWKGQPVILICITPHAGLCICGGRALQDFSPCELFARIRGRTLWLMGDSQAYNLYYALECFLREFAPSLRRTWVPLRLRIGHGVRSWETSAAHG